MWPITFSIGFGILVVLLELPPLFKKKQYKEAAIFSLLTISSLTIYAMQTLHYHLPNPLELIKTIYEWFL